MSTEPRPERRLAIILESFRDGALVAFSGGVDSTLLLSEAHALLGDRIAAFTADTPSIPRESLAGACEFTRARGIRHFVEETCEMRNPLFLENGPERCFHCKSELFATMGELGRRRGYPHLLYGAVLDDLDDVRPGMRAALASGARAPLLEAGFSKEEVRRRSRELGISGWDRPAAACLASRIPTGTPIRTDDLVRVEAAERALHALGFPACRVRLLGKAARVEVPVSEVARLASDPIRTRAVQALKELGFSHATLDLEGYRPAGLSLLQGRGSSALVREDGPG